MHCWGNQPSLSMASPLLHCKKHQLLAVYGHPLSLRPKWANAVTPQQKLSKVASGCLPVFHHFRKSRSMWELATPRKTPSFAGVLQIFQICLASKNPRNWPCFSPVEDNSHAPWFLIRVTQGCLTTFLTKLQCSIFIRIIQISVPMPTLNLGMLALSYFFATYMLDR